MNKKGMAMGALALSALLGIGLAAEEAAKPLMLDDCESVEVSNAKWTKTDGVELALSDEHVTEGKHCLKLTVGKAGGGLKCFGKDDPQDWSKYQSVSLDVYNPQDYVMALSLRIDDLDSRSYKSRFEPSGEFWLPPKRSTHVEIRLDDLQRNNFHYMDVSKITYFGFRATEGATGRIFYVDAIQLNPYPKGAVPEPLVEATEPKLIDGGESEKDSLELWKASGAKVEISDERATEGKHSLKVTYPVSKEWPGLKFDLTNRPQDWQPYKSLEFDAYNASEKSVEVSVRIDGSNSIDIDGRYGVEGISLPPQRWTSVKLDIWLMAGRCGIRIDKSRITLLAIFMCGPAKEQTVYFDNIRLGVTRDGGLLNEVTPGRIPGKNPAALAKDLLEDPEIKPLLPIFKAIPPRRFVLLSHSASMSDHFATSGGYLDIVAETIKLVNPGSEYVGFHKSCLNADGGGSMFLPQMLAYKPTDTFIAIFPDSYNSLCKLGDSMASAGSRVFIFDWFPWGNFGEPTLERIRAYAKEKEKNGIRFVEIVPRTWGVPNTYRFQGIDIHMVTKGHIFYAKEVLKELAKVYEADAAAGKPPAAKP
jgi:hypothetical protein